MKKVEEPLVSILVPVWNVEGYVERCVRSLFEQTYPRIEYLFVDDCSPDQSMQVIRQVASEYSDRQGQTRFIQHERNRGLSAVRNTAVLECKGDFIFHVDSDDWVERNAVELLVEKQKETNADIVTGRAYVHFLDKQLEYGDGGHRLEREDALLALVDGRVCHNIWMRLIRASLYWDHDVHCIEGANYDEDFQVIVPLFYYSKKVAGIYNFVYHYNRMNGHSYVNNLNTNIGIQDQYFKSILSLGDFFKDKETAYREAAGKCKVRALWNLMKWSAMNGEKKRYRYFREMLSHESKYWSAIQWDKPIVRMMEGHYHLSRIALPLKVVWNFTKRNSFSMLIHRISIWRKGSK